MEQSPTVCDYHGKNTVMVCKTCDNENICLTCISTMHKGHMIAPIKRPKKVTGFMTMCPRHGRNLIYVCKTCNRDLLCWSCYYPRHKGHDCIDFEDFMKRMRDKMNNIPDAAPKSKTEMVTVQIKQRREELKTQIDTVADRLVMEYANTLKQHQKQRVKLPKFKVSSSKSKDIEKLFGNLKIK